MTCSGLGDICRGCNNLHAQVVSRGFGPSSPERGTNATTHLSKALDQRHGDLNTLRHDYATLKAHMSSLAPYHSSHDVGTQLDEALAVVDD